MSDPQEVATPSDPHSAEALDLDAIQKRADAATAGPWDYITQGVIGRADQSSEDAMDNPVAMVRWSELDAEFIAHARTDVPALVAAVRSRDAEVAELKAKIADAWDEGREAEQKFRELKLYRRATNPYRSASSPVEGGGGHVQDS